MLKKGKQSQKNVGNINSMKKPIIGIIMGSGIVMSLTAGFTPIGDLAELVNIGTLAAFVLVCGGVIALRITKPNLERPFKLSYHPVIPVLGIIFCLYLMFSLPFITWVRFSVWMLVGIAIYAGYGYRNSLAQKQDL